MHSARIKVVDPDNVQVTLSVTASVKTWRRVAKILSADLDCSWDQPSSEILTAMTNAVRTVDREFVGFSTVEDDTP